MALWPLLVGLLFFANPYLAAIDLVPDFLGALLIALFLIPLSRLFPSVREAREAFLRLALVDFVKALLLVFVFSSSALGEQEVLLLIVAFLSATVGTLFAVLAFRALFDGLYAVVSVMPEGEGSEDRTAGLYRAITRTSRLSVIFLVGKEAVSLLPEFAALLNTTYVDSGVSRLYDYIGTMRLLVTIPVAIASVFFILLLVSFFRRLFAAKGLRVALTEYYEAYMAEHPGIRVQATHAVALTLMGVGGLLLADFYLDFQNMIPDALGALLLLIGILLLRMPMKNTLPAALSVGAFGAVAYVSSELSYRFSSSHKPSDILRSEVVAAEYTAMWIFSLLEMLLFLGALLCLLLFLRAVLVKWGGYKGELDVEHFEERNERRMREEFDGRLITCFVLGLFSGVASFFFDYFKNWPDTKIFRLMEGFWILDLLLALAFGSFFCYLLFEIMERVRERFQYE